MVGWQCRPGYKQMLSSATRGWEGFGQPETTPATPSSRSGARRPAGLGAHELPFLPTLLHLSLTGKKLAVC